MRTEILTGKTVEEAVLAARAKFATDDNEISYEILELPKKGFLGFGVAPAKIKVTISESKDILSELNLKGGLNVEVEKKPQPQIRNNKPAQTPKVSQKQSNVKPAPNQGKVNNSQQVKSDIPKTQTPNKVKPPQVKSEISSQAAAAPKAEKKVQQNNQNQQGNQSKKIQNNDVKTAPVKEPRGFKEKAEKTFEPRHRDEMDQITLSQEELDCAVSFIDMVLGHMELKDVSVTPLGLDDRKINLDGEGSGALIGHHGETLDAIQYLTNLHVNRKAEMADAESGEKKHRREYVKVTVDIEGYRARREETLRALARRMADRALKYKKNVFLEPMNPYERRIIHSEIQLIEGVGTHSVGSDDNRKIVITVNGVQQSRGYKGGYNKSKKPPQNVVDKPVHDIAEPENTEVDFLSDSDDEKISIED